MVSRPIPGIYSSERDATIGLSPTGGGYIGLPVKLERGEIGVPIYVRDTTELKSFCGYPIVGYNMVSWNYADNIFFYSSNLALSRVEVTEHSYDLEDREIVCGASNAQVGIWQSGHTNNPDLVEEARKLVFLMDDTANDWGVLAAFLDTSGTTPYDPQMENLDTSILIKNYVQDVDDKNIYTEESEARTEYSTLFSGASAFGLEAGSMIVDRVNDSSASGAVLEEFYRVSKVLSVTYSYLAALADMSDLARTIKRDTTYGTVDWSGSGSTRTVKSSIMTGDFLPSYLEVSGSGSTVAYWVQDGTPVYEYSSSDGTLTQVGTVDGITDLTNGTSIVITPLTPTTEITASSVLTFVDDDTYVANWAGIADPFYSAFTTVTKRALCNYVHLRTKTGYDSAYNGALPTSAAAHKITNVKDSATGSYTLTEINSTTFSAMATAALTDNKEVLRLVATTPGAWADRLNVTVTVSDMANFDTVAAPYFNYAPETSGSGYALDQIAIVIKADGELVDSLIGSLNPLAKDDNGASRYIVDVLNRKQSWLYLGVNPAVVTAPSYQVAFEPVEDVAVSGGHAAKVVTADAAAAYHTLPIASVQEALDIFKQKDEIDVTYIADGEWAGNQSVYEYIRSISAVTRRDCRGYCGPNPEDCRGFSTARAAWTNILSVYGTWVPLSNEDGQFVDFYANAKQVYDTINDTYVWISASSDAVGLHAQIDRTFDPWWPVAGNRRGGLKNVGKMAWNPDADIRVEMLKYRMIPIIYRRGEGYLIYDTINSYTKKSDLAENYNRKALNYMQKNAESLCNDYLFEFNDATSRYQLVSSLEPFFRNVQARRGLVSWKVQCDDKNNTAEIIDQNKMVVDIYLVLPRISKQIHLNWVLNKASTTAA